MLILKSQVGYFLLLLLSISALHQAALGARYLEEIKNENPTQTQTQTQLLTKSFNSTTNEGFFATIDREVPSSPDPLHNR
ncbi:unnamed protein product [Camellia sinensis]